MGFLSDFLWDFCVMFIGFVWDFYGNFVGFLWDLCGIFMVFLWCFASGWPQTTEQIVKLPWLQSMFVKFILIDYCLDGFCFHLAFFNGLVLGMFT